MWKNIILEPFVVIAKNTRITKNSEMKDLIQLDIESDYSYIPDFLIKVTELSLHSIQSFETSDQFK